MTQNDGPKKASRGEKTRAKILSVSTKLFAKKGFHEVTTRKIAGLCPCNLAAIAYHFGGKDGLYRAVLEEVTRTHAEKNRPLLDDLERQIECSNGHDAIICRAVERTLCSMVRLFLTHPDAIWIHDIITRELTDPSEHASIIYEGCVEPLNSTIRNLYAKTRGAHKDSTETIIAAKLIIAQITAPLTYQKVFLNDLGWNEFTSERLDEICRAVSDSVLRILGITPENRICEEVR